jgi:hypothetical protein
MRRVAFECYQIAGQLLIGSDTLTKGQRTRLETLLLDTLSDPDRYPARVIRALRKEALEP